MKNIYLVLFFAVLTFSSCKNKDTAVAPPPSQIKVFEVKPQTVPLYKEYVGQIYGENDIPIVARVEGYLDKIYFKEGSRVKKGELLYAIDPNPLLEKVAAARSQVAQSQTMLVQKESDLARIKPLAEIDAVSKSDLDAAQADRDAAISSLDASKANLSLTQINLGYAKLYSPINGIIGRTLAREGEFVGRSPSPVTLNTVSEIKNVRAQFFLSENEYLLLAREYMKNPEMNNEKSSLQLILSDGTVYRHNGEFDFIDRSVDPSTGAILLQASFPNPEGYIRPGQFARVKVNIQNVKDALLIPQKCVTELQGLYSVFVVNSENKLASTQIEVGDKIGDYWLVKKGLKSNDKVVSDGLQKVRDGMEIVPVVTEFKSQTNIQ